MPDYQYANLEERSRQPQRDAAAQPEAATGPQLHPLVALQGRVGNAQVARMLAQRAAAEDELAMKRDPALIRREGAPEEEEELQAKRDPALVRREGAPEEEEELQAKRDPALIRREGAPEEEEELQAKRDPALVRREGAPDEEEELQAKRDPALVRREGAPDEEEELQAKRDPTLQRKEDGIGLEGGPLSDDLISRIDSNRSGGSGLPDATRSQMEGAFGTDLGAVRVHQDAESDSLARTMTAKAFTTGSDIFLRKDMSANDTSLMAHELTHVVQQSTGQGGSGSGMTVGAADHSSEHEANSVAKAVTSGVALRKTDDRLQ